MKMQLRNLIRRFLTLLVLLSILLSGSVSPAFGESSSLYTYEDQFTSRDLRQTPDLADSTALTLQSGQDVHITSGGIYVLSSAVAETTVYVEAGDEDKVQLVLDQVQITNESFPCIYVVTADKVWITTVSDSSLAVTGAFRSDGDINTDSVIFSRQDLTLNGTAALSVSSSQNGIVSKDDLKVTGGVFNITAESKALEANDSIRIADGELSLTAGTDTIHAENAEDDSLGYVTIWGGTLTLVAVDDAIHATSAVQIEGGTFSIQAAEGIEGTLILINGGTLSIQATDDGINAASKSGSYSPKVEINGGEITIVMGAGDTDGIDSNGDIVVNGGTVNVTAGSTFDYDGTAAYNGGTIICNGQQVASIPNQRMGSRGGFSQDGFGGGFGGHGGHGGRGGW